MLNKNLNESNKPVDTFDESEITDDNFNFKILEIDKLHPNPDQPRKFFDNRHLQELAQSIRENGILQPILVRKFGETYQIVSGERRYRASLLAGLKKIPAVVKKLDEERTLLAGLIENIQRQDLNPIEEAKTLKEIILNHGLTHDQLAERIGRSRSALTNRLRLLQLPSDVQSFVIENQISAGHAKMLAGIKEPHRARLWAKRIIKDKLSVYETEQLITNSKQQTQSVKKKKEKGSISSDIHIRAVEENLQEMLGAKVRIKQGKSKGRIEIEFYNNEDLERVVESMASMIV